MTVETSIRQVEFTGNGLTTVFVVPFPFIDPAHVRVTLIDGTSMVAAVLSLDNEYTLTGGDPTGELTTLFAPPTGSTLLAVRAVPYTQPMNLEPNDGFDAVAMEQALDRLTMLAQQAADSVGGGGGGGGGTSDPPPTISNLGVGEPISTGLVANDYGLRSFMATGTGLSVSKDAEQIIYTVTGLLSAPLNLSDVANRQTSLNTLTAASAAGAEFVLTKDGASGNALWKVVPTGGGGEANTTSNAGGTVGLALAKVGANLPFRGLTAGANISLTPSGTDVVIAASTVGEANTSSSAGGTVALALAKVGVNLPFRGLTAGSNITLTPSGTDVVIAAAGLGEANTSSSAGGTVALALAKSGVNLPFRGLTAGTNITLTPSGTDVVIAAAPGAGEANDIKTVANTGQSLIPLTSKVGVNLQTKGIAASLGIILAPTTTDIGVGIDQTATLAWTGRHTLTRNATTNTPASSVWSLNAGAMVNGGALLNDNYLTAFDIRKTTDAATEAVTANRQGGLHALYVQHHVTGAATTGARLFGGVRSQINAYATGTPVEYTAFYGAVQNSASVFNAAWAFYCDVFHDNTSNGRSMGFAAEIARSQPTGSVFGYVSQIFDISTYPSDVGFLVAKQSAGTTARRFKRGVSIGYAPTPIPAEVDIGFDTLDGVVNTASFRMASGQLFRLGGSTDIGDMRYDSTDQAIQFLSSGNKTFGVDLNGIPAFYGASGTLVGAAGLAAPMPTPARYVNVRYNTGTLASPVIVTGKIAIFNF